MLMIAESEEGVVIKPNVWRDGLEKNGLRENLSEILCLTSGNCQTKR